MSKKPRRVVKQDNVLYINFGKTPGAAHAQSSSSKQPATPPERKYILNRNQTPDISAWFLRLISMHTDAGRVKRGREYYRAGNVLDVSVSAHAIHTSVRGSQLDPFVQEIRMPFREPNLATQVVEFLLSSGMPLKNLREGVLPPELFALLVGGVEEEPRVRCDCPDHAEYCKHIVAALHATAEYFSMHPTKVLELRGLSILSLETALIEHGQSKAETAAQLDKAATDSAGDSTAGDASDEAALALQLQQRTEHFWNGTALPPVPQPAVAPAIEDGDLQLLHKAMRQICYSTPEELRAVSDIEDLYHALTHLDADEGTQ